MVNFLTDVISPGDQCVCVFTKQEGFQRNLVLENDGTSKSGIWKLDLIKMEEINKVIIYYRHDGINEIIIGDYQGVSPTIFRDHFCINFKITNISQTLRDWVDFCDTDSSPIRYYP
jgi:hypothetical protein